MCIVYIRTYVRTYDLILLLFTDISKDSSFIQCASSYSPDIHTTNNTVNHEDIVIDGRNKLTSNITNGRSTLANNTHYQFCIL